MDVVIAVIHLVLVVLCRSTAYDRKRRYDTFDSPSYVSTADMRLAKESRFMPSQSQTLVTGALGEVTSSSLPPQFTTTPTLLMAPPVARQIVPGPTLSQSAVLHAEQTASAADMSYPASLPPPSSLQH